MRTERVNRYYCDWCKKSGCSAYHMRRHEAHCTMNPDRKCGVCKQPVDIAAAISHIPDLLPYKRTTFEAGEMTFLGDWCWYEFPDGWAENFIATLEDEVDGCPACMLAALRQAGVAAYVMQKFDFKKRLEDWWESVNLEMERREHEYY